MIHMVHVPAVIVSDVENLAMHTNRMPHPISKNVSHGVHISGIAIGLCFPSLSGKPRDIVIVNYCACVFADRVFTGQCYEGHTDLYFAVATAFASAAPNTALNRRSTSAFACSP